MVASAPLIARPFDGRKLPVLTIVDLSTARSVQRSALLTPTKAMTSFNSLPTREHGDRSASVSITDPKSSFVLSIFWAWQHGLVLDITQASRPTMLSLHNSLRLEDQPRDKP